MINWREKLAGPWKVEFHPYGFGGDSEGAEYVVVDQDDLEIVSAPCPAAQFPGLAIREEDRHAEHEETRELAYRISQLPELLTIAHWVATAENLWVEGRDARYSMCPCCHRETIIGSQHAEECLVELAEKLMATEVSEEQARRLL